MSSPPSAPGTRRPVPERVDRLAQLPEAPDAHYPILCAPYISVKAAEVLKSHRVGYIDLSGNCWLDLGFLFVERSGQPNRFKVPKEQRNLFAARASRIVRTMLEHPGKDWTLQELAQTSGVSVGLVHRVAMVQDGRTGMQEIASYARKLEVRYVFTGPAAASLLVPHLMVSAIHCYVDALKPVLLDSLKADPVPSGGNLWFSVIQREDIFLGSHQIEDLYVVSDIQMYLDLSALGGR